jgi:hypothetical protein
VVSIGMGMYSGFFMMVFFYRVFFCNTSDSPQGM